MSETSIRVCLCDHQYQDKRYGKGKRVKNATKDNGWVCTVCGQKESPSRVIKRDK